MAVRKKFLCTQSVIKMALFNRTLEAVELTSDLKDLIG